MATVSLRTYLRRATVGEHAHYDTVQYDDTNYDDSPVSIRLIPNLRGQS